MGPGTVVERLTVLAAAPPLISRGGKPRARWLCLCECGEELPVLAQSLNLALRAEKGGSRSCGCLAREINTKHGEAACGEPSPEYQAWISAKKRCYSPSNASYDDYGARGIRMCDRWRKDFPAFLEDMGRRPTSEHSLEREDPDGDYEPGNCRWATIEEQNRNRRCVTLHAFEGSRLTLGQIAAVLGLTRGQVRGYAERGELRALEREVV